VKLNLKSHEPQTYPFLDFDPFYWNWIFFFPRPDWKSLLQIILSDKDINGQHPNGSRTNGRNPSPTQKTDGAGLHPFIYPNGIQLETG
jgi:hypothetical protein